MRAVAVLLLIGIIYVMVASTFGQTGKQSNIDTKSLTSNQALMRDKLLQMNRVLEGLTLNKFDQVGESAKVLGMISRATSWHVSDPQPRYKLLSKNFQEVTADLERHAKEQNTDAATLDLVRLNVTCAQCHQFMRENPAEK
jgi:hypothetical protein